MGGLAPRAGEWRWPTLSGLLLAASYPPLHLVVPPFVALVPFALWIARLPPGADGSRAAARGGLVLGLVMHGLLLHWIVPALAWVTVWAPLAFLLVVTLLSSLSMLTGWGIHRAVHGAGSPMWLALPVLWTATEWLQGRLPGTLSFPWLGLGMSLTARPEWVGIAELVGARGVSFWLAAVSGTVVWAILRRAEGGGHVAVRLSAVGLVAILPAAWGVARAHALETVPVARVAVVQSQIPAAVRGDSDRWNAEARTVLDRLWPVGPPPGVDLLVLPEGWLAWDADGAGGADGADDDEARRTVALLQGWAAEGGLDILLGVYAPGPAAETGEGGGMQNTIRRITAQGMDPRVYVKQRMVPWVETGGLGAAGHPAFGTGSPEGGTVLGSGSATYGALVCFEAIFEDAARRARSGGADVLVNVTNDGWFGVAGWGAAVARDQHAAHLVMRAVEHRVGAVRAANGGYAFVVHPTGHVTGRAESGQEAVVLAEVRTTAGRTLFTRFGDWVGLASVGGAMLLLGLAQGGRRTGPSRASGLGAPSLDPRGARS